MSFCVKWFTIQCSSGFLSKLNQTRFGLGWCSTPLSCLLHPAQWKHLFLLVIFPHVKAKLAVFFVSFHFHLCLRVENCLIKFSPLCPLSWSSLTFFFSFFLPPDLILYSACCHSLFVPRIIESYSDRACTHSEGSVVCTQWQVGMRQS